MSKAHMIANEHKNLREQIMFHLSFCLMMKFSGRDEMAARREYRSKASQRRRRRRRKRSQSCDGVLHTHRGIIAGEM